MRNINRLMSDEDRKKLFDTIEMLGWSNAGRRADFTIFFDDGGEYVCRWVSFEYNDDSDDIGYQEWIEECFAIERIAKTSTNPIHTERGLLYLGPKNIPIRILFRGIEIYSQKRGIADHRVLEALKGNDTYLYGVLSHYEHLNPELPENDYVIEYEEGDKYKCRHLSLGDPHGSRYRTNGLPIDDNNYRCWIEERFSVDRVIADGPNHDAETNTIDYSAVHIPRRIWINGILVFDSHHPKQSRKAEKESSEQSD